jgi:hypothetical protein
MTRALHAQLTGGRLLAALIVAGALARSYVVQVAWIPARTWANDRQGGLVFWLHATLRRGAGTVR